MTVKPERQMTGFGKNNQATEIPVLMRNRCKKLQISRNPNKKWSERRDLNPNQQFAIFTLY
jgi:hypothetical protein